MYNEPLKREYIRSVHTSISKAEVCEIVFNAIEKYEEEWGADICTRSAEEIQPVIDQIVGIRARSKWQRLIILKEYVRWCLVNKVNGACDGMLKIQTVGLEKIRQQMLSGPMHLENYLNLLFDPASEQTNDNIFRCYLWLAYGGMDEEFIPFVKCNDVDFVKMEVRCAETGAFAYLYKEGLEAFRCCAEMNAFRYLHARLNHDKFIPRADGDELLRSFKGVPAIKSIRVDLCRRRRDSSGGYKTDMQISHYRAWLSGLFWRTYELERFQNIPPSFKAAAEHHMEGREYKLDSGRNLLSSKNRQLERDYLEDYQRWKLAYYSF